MLSDTDMWNALPFMHDLSLKGNALSGELPSSFSFNSVELLDLANNRFAGPIPDLPRHGRLVGLSLRGNALSGPVPNTSAPRLFFLQLEKNDLTAGGRDLLDLSPNALWLSWWDNDGLCVDRARTVSAVARGALLHGPRCGSEPGAPLNFAVSPGNAVLTALGDSILVEVTAIDEDGWRTEGAVTWINKDPDVATIAPAADGMWRIRAKANGTTSILGLPAARPEDPFTSLDPMLDPIEVTVKQLPVDSEEETRLTFAAGTSFKWEEAAGVDRNGHPLPVPDGFSTESSDSSIVVGYRNQIFYAIKKGTTVISSRNAGEVIARAEITVTAPPLRPDPNDTPVITGLSADTLAGGTAVTIYGRNLDATDEVWVDGVRARLQRRDADAVRVQVPDIFLCGPHRNVAVIVRNNVGVGDVLVAPMKAKGEDLSAIPLATLHGPVPIPLDGETCLFSRSGDGEYLLGIQGWPLSSHPNGASGLATIFEVNATTTTFDDRAAANVLPVPPKIERRAGRSEPEDADWLYRHREAELARWQQLQEELEKRPLPGGRGLARTRTSAVHANTVEGDTVLMRISQGCESFIEFPAVVRVVNDHVVVLGDAENQHDYTDAEYVEFAAVASDVILPALLTQFGPPSDVNGDDRVTMLFTDKVASLAGGGVLGFVNFLNFLPRSDCAGSNEMEMFVGTTPIPFWDRDFLLSILPTIIGHELTHVIQGQRFLAQETIASLGIDIWLAEAQAVLGEEIVAHAAMGNAPGNNYGPAVVQSTDEEGRRWYLGPFADFSNLFDSNAPNACSWWIDGSRDPCGGRPLWYGIGWSFMRWVADQYGPTFPTGEAGFNTALIRAPPGNEILNFESLLDEDFGTLLAGWAAALYLDDRLEAADAAAPFQMTSWNLADIFDARGISIPVAQPHRSHPLRAGSVLYYPLERNPFGASLFNIRGKVSESQDRGVSASKLDLKLQVFIVPLTGKR